MDSSKRIIIWLLCLGNIAISFNIGAVAAAIPLIAQDFHLGDLIVANIVVFYMIPYGVGALLYAPLSRVVTYKRILAGASFAYSVFAFITAVSPTLDRMLVAQIGAGIAAASSTPMSLMIIGELFEKNVRGRLVGAYFGCSFFASVVGMVFMGTAHWRWLFMIPTILALITGLGWVFLKSDFVERVHKASFNYVKALSRNHIRDVFVFIFVTSFLYHAVHKWYGVYLTREYGLSKEMISIILIVAALCGLAGQQIGGYFSDKKGRLFACYMGMSGLGVGVMLLLGSYPLAFIIAILSAISIGWTMSHNSISTILTDFPDADRPMIASLNSSVRFVSGGIGFWFSKFLVEKSFGWTFFGIGAIFLVLIIFVKYVFPSDINSYEAST